jgi:hypothetical protein
VLGQQRSPDVGVGGLDHVDELALLVTDLAAHAFLGGGLLRAADHAHRLLGTDAEDEIANRRQHQRADAAAGDAHWAQAAPILDIALATSPTPFHAIGLLAALVEGVRTPA